MRKLDRTTQCRCRGRAAGAVRTTAVGAGAEAAGDAGISGALGVVVIMSGLATALALFSHDRARYATATCQNGRSPQAIDQQTGRNGRPWHICAS